MSVLFLVLPARSHLIATFGLAKKIKERGRTVYYACPQPFIEYIHSQGFNFCELNSHSFGYGYEEVFHKANRSKFIFLDAFIDRLSNRFYLLRKIEIETIIQNIKPVVVFVDVFINTDYIILNSLKEKCNFQVFFLQTMLNTRQNWRLPAINSSSPPNGNLIFISLVNLKIRFWVRFRQFYASMIYLGRHNIGIVKYNIKNSRIREKKIFFNGWNYEFKDVKEVILAQEELEFQKQINPDVIYLGNLVDLDRKEENIDINYTNYFHIIRQRISNENLKLIYCSFGSIYKYKPTLGFLKKVIRLTNSLTKVILVIATDKSLFPPNDDILKHRKVYIFNRVPQLDLLKYADVFITHGGLNSIKESLLFKVPMLIYPLDPRWDNIGNATKVEYFKLGLKGRINYDSEKTIRHKVNYLLNSQQIKESINNFHQQLGRYDSDVEYFINQLFS